MAPHWTQFDGDSSTVTRPSSPVSADGVHLRRAHVGPQLGDVRRHVPLHADVVGLVVPGLVAGGEDRRELVEGELAVRRRILAAPDRSAAAADWRRGIGRNLPTLTRPFEIAIAPASAAPTKKPRPNTWRMSRTSWRSRQMKLDRTAAS